MSSFQTSYESISSKRVLLFIAHGSREEKSNQAFFNLLGDFRRQNPDERVEGCFLEIVKPLIPDAIESAIRSGVQEIFIVPLMLFRGRHAEQDIPTIIQEARTKYPHVDFHYASPLSEDPSFLEVLSRKVKSFPRSHSGKNR